MSKFFAPLLLIGITVVFLASNFFTGTKDQLAALIMLEPLVKPSLVRQNGRQAVVAQIYSTFPFNHKNLLTLNAGSDDGVAVGAPVTLDGNILFGQIVEVSSGQSVARTIFDKEWSLSARIGSNYVDALLIGGQNPRLTLIDKDDEILEGETIFSAQKDFPYGLKIGTVKSIRDLVANSFKEAGIDLPYNIKSLREVAIVIK